MKRNYEKEVTLILLIVLFIILEFFILLFYYKKSYRTYETINVFVVTDNYIKTYVSNTTLKKLKSASKFYIDDKIYKYEIIEIEKNVLKKNNINYHGVFIKTNYPNKYKDNDTVIVSIFSNKKKIYNIFKSCLESDENE